MSKQESQARARLQFLCRITRKEAEHLEQTAGHLFPTESGLSEEIVQGWVNDLNMSERLDAFVTRFSRLQDTVGDKLIPALLSYLQEKTGPAIDNLNRAEKFGWLKSAEDWIILRKLRNQMVHEYIEDISVLTDALRSGQSYVPELTRTARQIIDEAERRLSGEQ